jgi:ribosome-binding protein aMBF1 (putative translation factor)
MRRPEWAGCKQSKDDVPIPYTTRVNVPIAYKPQRGCSESRTQLMITPAQLRAARAIVGWSREKLAEKSGVGMPTIRDFELNNTDSKQGTVNKWRRALEIAGVEFIEEDDIKGPGVRLRESSRNRRQKR